MVNQQTVNCETVWKEISNYIDGEVDPGLRASIEAHIAGCPKCASVLAGTRNVVRLYSDERMLEAPAGFSRRLEKRLAQGAKVSGARWSSWTAWLVPVAALLLIGVVLQWGRLEQGAHRLLSPHAQPGDNIPPDLPVVVAGDSKVFHVVGCGLIKGKTNLRSMTAKQARDAGYVPCVRCLRKYLQSASLPSRSDKLEADDDTDESPNVAEEKTHALR